MNRSEARENAFILVFEKSFNNIGMSELIEQAVEARQLVDNSFMRRLATGVFENIEKIDSVIAANCVGWKLERVSRVALAVMRLCCYEMLYEKEIPTSVSINEAVIIAKKYAGEEDSAYINGVLGSISRMENFDIITDESINSNTDENIDFKTDENINSETDEIADSVVKEKASFEKENLFPDEKYEDSVPVEKVKTEEKAEENIVGGEAEHSPKEE